MLIFIICLCWRLEYFLDSHLTVLWHITQLPLAIPQDSSTISDLCAQLNEWCSFAFPASQIYNVFLRWDMYPVYKRFFLYSLHSVGNKLFIPSKEPPYFQTIHSNSSWHICAEQLLHFPKWWQPYVKQGTQVLLLKDISWKGSSYKQVAPDYCFLFIWQLRTQPQKH